MTSTTAAQNVSTIFGTFGPVQRQVRQLLNTDRIPDDADRRPVAFTLAQPGTGSIPEELDARAWVHGEDDTAKDPVLVVPAVSGSTAVYLAINLAERATVSALDLGLRNQGIELVVAGVGGCTRHRLHFSACEMRCLENFVGEYF